MIDSKNSSNHTCLFQWLSHCLTSVLRVQVPEYQVSEQAMGPGNHGWCNGLDDLGVPIVSLEISMMYVCLDQKYDDDIHIYIYI